MNDKYISVLKFKQSLAKLTVEGGDKKYAEAIARTLSEVVPHLLDDSPAADVQPVECGEWDFQGYQLFKCTNCKEIFTQNQLEAMQNHIDQEEFTFPNFCPNCGADMRGDTNG